MRLRTVLAVVSILFATVCAHGDTISEFTGGAGVLDLSTYDGQAFTVLGGGTYTNINFNFYSAAGDPYAVGTAYLFSSPYSGTPAGLSSATTGLLGSAMASGGVYSFGSGVTLTAGDTYYLFEDTLIPEGSILGASISALDFYESNGPDAPFGAAQGTANYLVTGDPTGLGTTPTPEPSSMILLATGVLGSAAIMLRRRLC